MSGVNAAPCNIAISFILAILAQIFIALGQSFPGSLPHLITCFRQWPQIPIVQKGPVWFYILQYVFLFYVFVFCVQILG